MKKRNNLVATSLIACGILAYSSLSAADMGDISVGFKVGQTLITDDLLEDSRVSQDDKIAFGFNVDYSFAPDWSGEFEYITGGTEFSGNAGSVDADTNSVSLYAVYRSPGPIYFIGKAGLTRSEIDIEGFGGDSDTGFSFGLGGGYQLMPKLTLEADYTKVDEDNDWFMISARYQVK